MNPSLLLNSAQFLSFLTILGAGFVYIVAAWALSSAFGDHDFDHDHDVGAEHEHGTVSIFSPKVVAIFMVGFGAAGCFATFGGLGVVVSLLVGLLGGAVIGGLMLLGLRLLYSQQSSSQVLMSGAVGKTAVVTVPIALGEIGEVSVTVSGQYMTYSARGMDKFLPNGTQVTVLAAHGSTLTVQ